uniref:Progestin and adipoQ receptor family member IIIb n=1 Tax=Oncorhynchus mykiss TaxID=8022 RepID=A0A8C7VR50_ONCMY
MPQKLKLHRSSHYIELGSYQYWPVLVPRGIRLYTFEQIPLFLKENPYITDGYRAHLTSKLCLKSIFVLSNETVNIWTHLLGFLLFFLLGVNDMSTVLPASGANREDYVIYCIGLFCFQVCMLCSVGYHLFSCHRSEKTCHRWLALDYAGISVGILGCYIPGVFYAFYCNIFWRQVYLVIVLALILAIFSAQIHPHYLSKEWQHLRTVIFCSVAGYGVIPAVHWVWLNGGFSSAVVQVKLQNCYTIITKMKCIQRFINANITMQENILHRSEVFLTVLQLFLPRVIVMYLIAGAAFLFYISKIPERCFPGQLNYLGASHQVWHVLVVFMFYWWHQTAVYIMNFRHNQPCPPLYTNSG